MSSEPGKSRQDSDCDVRNPFRQFRLTSYLKEELFQSVRKHQEQAGSEDRGPFNNRLYTFLTVPQYLESFMCYGLLQCLDQLLMLYTLLPVRCLIVLWRLLIHLLRHLVFAITDLLCMPLRCSEPAGGGMLLYSHELRDICRFVFITICSGLLAKFDTSVAYHEIRTQSVVKIYIFFNLLEVADRLLSAVCQDALDDLFHTVSDTLQTCCDPARSSEDGEKEEAKSGSLETEVIRNGDVGSGSRASTEEVLGSRTLSLTRDLFFQFGFALICLFAHCFLLMCQVTTLNVAFNSQNKSLVTVFISNNFVELKGNVFRKMGKTNLFQIACADVRERFHYSVWLFIVVTRNMTDTGWNLDDLWEMLFDVICIFLAEVAVDWVKHAFITKFNVIPSDVYREYTVSLAFDLLLCRQGNNTSDYFDLLSRRMGLTPIPLSCLINVMLLQTVQTSSPFFLYYTLPSVILALFTLKILVNVCLLAMAYSHVKAYIKVTQAANQQQPPPPPADKTAVPCAVITTSTNDLHSGTPTGRQQRMVPTLAPPVGDVARQLGSYEVPTQDEQSFWSPSMVLRRRRIRMHSETCQPPPSSTPSLHKLGSEPAGERLVDPITTWSNWPLDRSSNWPTRGQEVPRDEVFALNLSSELSNSVGLGSRINTPSGSTSLLNEAESGSQPYATLASEVPVLSSSLLKDHQQEDEEPMVAEESDTGGVVYTSPMRAGVTSPSIEIGQHGNRWPGSYLRRSFSIDMGVLSTFSRFQLTKGQTVETSAKSRQFLSIPLRSDDQQVVPRRRSRTRTYTYSSAGDPSASHTALRWEEDVLPVLWEKSSRNSVVQTCPVLEIAGQPDRLYSGGVTDAEALVPQPLSNIDRYSMLEGQIS